MGKVCIQCNKKIGFFSKPIEGVYCNYDCRNESRAETERLQRETRELAEAAARQAEEAESARRQSEAVSKAAAEQRSRCPKCSDSWSYVQGGGALGVDVGDCPKCGFSAEFVSIDSCPHCHSQSLVVQSDHSARCPRCKYREGGYQRSA